MLMNLFPQYDNEQLLATLSNVRLPAWVPGDPFHIRDEQLYRSLIAELVRRGVYPAETVPGNPNDLHAMVDGYGAYWYRWTEPFACPHCKADLRDHSIGPPFRRWIASYDRDRDTTTSFWCPDCRTPI